MISDTPNTAAETPTPAPRRPVALPQRSTAAFDGYKAAMTSPGGPLDADTARAYLSRVGGYLHWLADAEDAGNAKGNALDTPTDRDQAVGDYRIYLSTVAKRAPATINAHLTAVADFYRRRAIGEPNVRREELPKSSPRTLDHRAQRRWMHAAEDAPPRDRALVHVAFYAGLRIEEITALDLGDIPMSARNGQVVVRRSPDGRHRRVPLHPTLRVAVELWLSTRTGWPGAHTAALFLNRRGGRLTVRGAHDVLRATAEAAGIAADFTPRALRQTFAAALTRTGAEPAVVDDLLGRARRNTARTYTKPTEEDRIKAVNRLPTDH